jgi:DNA-directed RNA polymerase subunit RPC12/RpoP
MHFVNWRRNRFQKNCWPTFTWSNTPAGFVFWQYLSKEILFRKSLLQSPQFPKSDTHLFYVLQLGVPDTRMSRINLAECFICRAAFGSHETLKLHVAKHASDRVRPYSCTICGRPFFLKTDLTRHIRTHTGEKPYTCDICGKKLSRKNIMKQHRLIKHGILDLWNPSWKWSDVQDLFFKNCWCEFSGSAVGIIGRLL